MAFVPSTIVNPHRNTTRLSSSFSSLAGNSRVCRNVKRKDNEAALLKRPSQISMISLPFFFHPEVISIPQNDKNPDDRNKHIAQARQQYQWTQEFIGGASMIDGLPPTENPEFGWVEEVVKVLIRVAMNTVAIRVDAFNDDAQAVHNEMLSRVAQFAKKVFSRLTTGQFDRQAAKEAVQDVIDIVHTDIEGAGTCLDEYRELFQIYKPDMVSADPYLYDEVFAWYRLAGPNPMRITKLDNSVSSIFPELTNDILQGIREFNDDTIEALESENRLFYVSYPEFSGLESGVFPDGVKKEGYYIYSPTALFAVPKEPRERTSLLPIAIRCDQSRDFPMFTANKKHTDEITWIAAKQTVQVADSVIHESVYHLGRTHLLMEVFNCALQRSLAPVHPIKKLLDYHFYGTCLINSAAIDALINPGGTIDNITAPQIETTMKVSANAVNSPTFCFNDWMPDKELASRGVLHADKLRFPYRDYAIRLWNIINEWVAAYLDAYYKSDSDVQNDPELATWSKEIVDESKGNLHGFGDNESGEIKTKAYLIRLISMIIFTASVQHAAVNFTQSSMMQFVPSMPLCGYQPPPKTERPFPNIDDWVTKMLPDLHKAKMQMDTAELIGVFQYTTLGEYGRSLNFLTDEAETALKKFQEQLSLVGADVQKQNEVEREAGLPPYTQLVPKNIPQSINI